MFCIYCGKELPEAAKFCPNCGYAQIEEGDDVQDVKPKTTKAQVEEVVNVKVVKPKITEAQAKEKTLNALKELKFFILMFAPAFVISIFTYYVIANMPYPKITQEAQEAYRNEQFKHNTGPGPGPIYGVEHLQLGKWKYDKEIKNLAQLSNINSARKNILERHAEDTANIIFWILLIGVPVVGYVTRLVKWLK